MTSPASIFLSYSREDQATARRFAQALEAEGFSVWWDQTLSAGEAFDQVTEKALNDARAVVVLWSKHAVESRWVRAEAAEADESGKLVPALIEPCSVPIKFKLTQTADLSGWHGSEADARWRQFVQGLRQFAGRESTTAAIAPAMATPTGTAVPSRRRWLGPLVGGVLVALLVIGGAFYWNSHNGATGSGDSGQGAGESQVSLAVLPFANLSSDPEQEYFSDGLTEEILNQLAQVQGLQLVGRTSSFAFKGKNEDLRSIGEQLGVANLLEGSIRKDGQNLRITAQLIRASNGTHLWSKAYDRQLSNVFTLQEEVARDVAQALSVRLDVGAMRRADGGTTNVDAYDLYLRARTLILRGGQDNGRQAAQLCREAVALDPQFARGWLELAAALVEVIPWMHGEEGEALNRERSEALTRVAQLLPGHWRAEVPKLEEFMVRHEWREAEQIATALMEAGPLNAESLDKGPVYVRFLVSTGRISEAIRVQRQMAAIEPLSIPISVELMRWLYADGRYAEANAEYERSTRLDGDHTRAQGRQLYHVLAAPVPDPRAVQAQKTIWDASSLNGQLIANLGNRDASITLVRKAFAGADPDSITQMAQLSGLADALGDRETALKGIRAVARTNLPFYIFNAPVSGVRAEPGFKEVMRELGLVDFWRETGKWSDYCKPKGDDDFECH